MVKENECQYNMKLDLCKTSVLRTVQKLTYKVYEQPVGLNSETAKWYISCVKKKKTRHT